MIVVVPFGAGAEAPHLVDASATMHEIICHEPFEHAINRDSIKSCVGKLLVDTVVSHRGGLPE
jgi:hypothetical protein